MKSPKPNETATEKFGGGFVFPCFSAFFKEPVALIWVKLNFLVIFKVVLYPRRDTVVRYLATKGRDLRSRLRPLYYEELPFARKIEAGTVIFADTERLSSAHKEMALELAARLEACGHAILNHPARALGRYEFLRAMHERGFNSYNVYRYENVKNGAETPRFPAFLRRETDHKGSMSAPLHSLEELRECAQSALDGGVPLADLMVAELCETDKIGGYFAKYSAQLIGETLILRHLVFSENWITKTPDVLHEELLEAERNYLKLSPHPHEEAIRRAFEIAGLNYGRIDYGLKCGKIEVWEINSNPTMVLKHPIPAREPAQEPVYRALNAAFLALETPQTARDLLLGANWRRKWGIGAAQNALFPFERATRRLRRHAIRSFVRLPARWRWLRGYLASRR